MGISKKMLKAMTCLLLAMACLACSEQKKKRTTPAVFRGNGNTAIAERLDSEAGAITGVIIENYNNQENNKLEESVKAFTASFMDSYSTEVGIGKISSIFQDLNQQGNTGVRFSLNICSNNKAVNSGVTSGQVDSSTANFKLYIKDSLSAANDGQFGVIEVGEYTLSHSHIHNSNITLTFTNNLGSITVDGNYTQNADWFVGKISFDNVKDFQNLSPFKGDLGVFYIPMNDISKDCR